MVQKGLRRAENLPRVALAATSGFRANNAASLSPQEDERANGVRHAV
jgi:hypothetical protein